LSPGSRPLGVRLERRELGRPERFDLFKPGAKDREALWPQPVHTDARVMLNTALLDEAAVPQHTEVTTQTGRTNRERRGEVAGTLWFPPQQVNDASPRRISERQERVVEVGTRH
jgi:hypothetical protein